MTAVNSMPDFRHFILTVFNVRTRYGGGAPPDRVWLEHRFKLFDSFCYPSVQGQTVQDFTWLVLFDAATPDDFRERIEAYRSWDRFVPVFVDEFMDVDSFARMKDRLIGDRAGSTDLIITTSLDNDDGLHRRFVEHLQAEARTGKPEFVNVSNGYVLDLGRNRLYRKRDLGNPFMSLIEPLKGFRTVWCAPHTRLASFGTVRQIETEPLWLQVVHGRNVLNRVGVRRRFPVRLLQDGFQLKFDVNESHESATEILLENIVTGVRILTQRFSDWRKA